jgi:hypothetical protein
MTSPAHKRKRDSDSDSSGHSESDEGSDDEEDSGSDSDAPTVLPIRSKPEKEEKKRRPMDGVLKIVEQLNEKGLRILYEGAKRRAVQLSIDLEPKAPDPDDDPRREIAWAEDEHYRAVAVPEEMQLRIEQKMQKNHDRVCLGKRQKHTDYHSRYLANHFKMPSTGKLYCHYSVGDTVKVRTRMADGRTIARLATVYKFTKQCVFVYLQFADGSIVKYRVCSVFIAKVVPKTAPNPSPNPSPPATKPVRAAVKPAA